MYSMSVCQILNGVLLAQKQAYSETLLLRYHPLMLLTWFLQYLHPVCIFSAVMLFFPRNVGALHKMSPSLTLTLYCQWGF